MEKRLFPFFKYLFGIHFIDNRPVWVSEVRAVNWTNGHCMWEELKWVFVFTAWRRGNSKKDNNGWGSGNAELGQGQRLRKEESVIPFIINWQSSELIKQTRGACGQKGKVMTPCYTFTLYYYSLYMIYRIDPPDLADPSDPTTNTNTRKKRQFLSIWFMMMLKLIFIFNIFRM